jgi:hypothetical protein
MDNAFLREFVKMRQSIGSKPIQKKETHLSGLSVATIIEHKPPAKLVLKYFKKKYGEESSSDED